MRALVVGCGSMGKRRIRDLGALGLEVIGFDSRADRREEVRAKFGIATAESLDAGLAKKPEIMAVCLPPVLHAGFVRAGLREGMHVFSEAPLALTPTEVADIGTLAAACGRLAAPSCTWLHHPYHLRIKEMMETGEIGDVLCFSSHFGGHLAGWHPYEGLDFYAVDRRNGGMGFDVLVHQVHLVHWLFGPAESVVCLAARRSTLPNVSGYDMYDLLLGCKRVSAAVHCDVVQRPATTKWSLWGEWGTINWTWDAMEIHKNGETRPVSLPDSYRYELVYQAEVAHFVDAASGKVSYRHSIEDERKALEILQAAEEKATCH